MLSLHGSRMGELNGELHSVPDLDHVNLFDSCLSDPFAGLVIFGIFGAWLVHVFVNVGMTVGMVPVTGIPLPFVSYGGTFLLMSWVAVAVAARLVGED